MTISHVDGREYIKKERQFSPLTLDEYQRKAAITARRDEAQLTENSALFVVAAINAAFAAGTRVEKLKKSIFHGKDVDLESPAIALRHLPKNSLMLNWILGLIGESAELSAAILQRQPREDIVKELGDVFWYTTMICSELGIDLIEVLQGNLAKLDKRHRGKFTEHKK